MIHHNGDDVEHGSEERPPDSHLADEAVLLPPSKPNEQQTEKVEPISDYDPYDPVEDGGNGDTQVAVSYTHLDVYKRQHRSIRTSSLEDVVGIMEELIHLLEPEE